MIKNTAPFDFNDKDLDNVRVVKMNSMPAVEEHLTADYYVDNAISNSVDEITFARINQDKDFSNYNLTKINSNTLKTQADTDNHVFTKAYGDQFYQEN